MILFYLMAGLIFLADRATKYLALKALATQAYHLFPGFSFSLAFNTGVSFSFFASSGAQSHWALTMVVAIIVALLIIVWRFFSSHSLLSNSGYALIIGGAIGNFYDRLYFGGVIDFIDIYIGRWHFPTFNVADIALSLGFLLIVWEMLYADE